MTIAFLSHIDMNLYLFRLPIMLELVRRGHTIYAVIPEGEYFHLFKKHHIQAVSYQIERKSINPFTEIKALLAIRKVLKQIQPDILHTFTAKPNIYGAIAGWWARIPIIVSSVTGLGSFYIDESFKSQMIRRLIESLYRSVLKRTDATIFMNSTDRQLFIDKKLIPESKARLVRSSGVDTGYFSPDSISQSHLKNELGIPEERIVVLMIARAIWHKGIAEYLEAARWARKEKPDLIFLLVGGADDGNPSCVPTEILSTQQDVLWLGERRDIRELIKLCDIFVLPSYREGVPRTLLEASAMAKPMVTTDTVGCTEVVEDGVNGFLVPIKDSQHLCEKIIQLANDTNLRNQMGQKARQKAEQEFDVKIVVSKYLDIYKELTGENLG